MKTLTTYLAIIAFLLANSTTYASNPNLPKGIVYQIEIDANDIQKTNQLITEYPYLSKITIQQKEYFQFGKFLTFNEADSVKNEILQLDCKNVSIIAFNDQEEISIADAISLQYKNQITDIEVASNNNPEKISNIEVEYLLQVQRSGLDHYYALAIPINSVEMVDKIFETIGDEQIIEISADNKIYSIGKFETLEEVLLARKKYIESDVNNVFVMAQITDQRIEDNDAKNLALTIQSVINGLASK